MGGVGTRTGALGLVAVIAIAGAAGMFSRSAGSLSWLERGTVDVRYSLQGHRTAPTDVAIVGIDDASVAALPRYPFSRALHAHVIDELHEAGARLIVYDISFDRPTTVAADDALFAAARRGAPIIFATSLISSSGATEVLGGNAQLRRLGDRAAAAELTPDQDGVLRHTLDGVNGLPSVAKAVTQTLGIPWREPAGRGWIDFPGGPGTVRPIPFVDVLRGRFDRAAVRGKVVVVGATASVLQDLHSTAAGSPMAGPEIQADAISTALAGFRLRSPSGLMTLFWIWLLAALAPALAWRFGSLGALFGLIPALALWSLGAQLAFDAGWVIDYSDALASLLLGAGGATLVGLWGERRERLRLRELFASGAEPVVAQVLGPGGLQATAIIAGYRIEGVVGRGGMGVVYRANQIALDRSVAIKLIAPERSHDDEFRARFKTESLIAASIEHANVIPVYEAGEDDGLLFIAMRLVDGSDLAQILAHRGSLDLGTTSLLIAQLASALDAAHSRELVHRDVKPANALITHDRPEHVYLTDFGIARHVGSRGLTGAGQWVGTLDYLAPEQIEGQLVSPSADIYALAGVLHHCLTGEIPFPRDSEPAKLWAHINADPPVSSAMRPGLPAGIDEVIARGMSKDPGARFKTAGELAAACASALGLPFPGGSAPALASERASGAVAPPAVERTAISS